MSTLLQIAKYGIVSCLGIVIIRFAAIKIIKYYINAYKKGQATLFFSGFNKYRKSKSQQLPRFTESLKRGDTVVRDYRSNKPVNKSTTYPSLRVVSLNMEMGKKINKVISSMKSLNADIICLQEVDLSTSRCHYIDLIAEMATELNMNSLFTVEVIVKDKKGTPGYEGNAILTKYDFIKTEGLIINCARYEKYKHKTKTHNEAVAVINVPGFGNIGCYSLHLDPHWCGVQGRVRQYHEILEHVKVNKNEYDHIIVCGDLNTACTGLNRLYPSIGCDNQSRFDRFGKTEAQWFDVEAVQKGNDKYGLDLQDPFDKVKDYTMYKSHIYSAKLDWCLMSNSLRVVNKKVNSRKKRCSDHQWIMCDVTIS